MEGQVARGCWLLLMLPLKGILAGDWSVQLPSGPICAVTGSSVVLPCSYDYPQSSGDSRGEGLASAQGAGGGEGQQCKVVSEMWCLEDSRCITQRYLFHSDNIFPEPSYQNRVQYLGQRGAKNCSLKISDLRPSDSGTYVFYLITNHTTQKMPGQRGVQLLVTDSPSAVAVSASPPSGITEGMTLRMACCSPEASPQAQFRWLKKTSAAPIHNGHMWNIKGVTSDNSGSYYCQIQSGDKVQDSAVLSIHVQYAPRNTAVSVSIAGDGQSFPVTLNCSSDANPPVHAFAWYQGAACLPTTDKSFHPQRKSPATPTGRGSMLRSGTIMAEEYGQYCCVARNRHGSQTASVTVSDNRAMDPSTSTGTTAVLIGVAICVLVVLIAIAVFLTARRRQYVLTATTSTEL